MVQSEFKKVLSFILFSIMIICILILAMIIWQGGGWSWAMSFSDPKLPIIFGFLALFGWFYFSREKPLERMEWKSFFFNAALVFGSLFFALLIGELLVRLYFVKTQGFNSLEQFIQYKKRTNIRLKSKHPLKVITRISSNSNLIYELIPNLKLNFGHKLVKTNSTGFRESREYLLEKKSSTLRILGVGDSGMWGWNLNQNEDYLSLLERNLQKRKGTTKYEVINLAVPGYNTHQEVETLESKGLNYFPDIVIVGWNSNDFDFPFFLYTRKNHFKSKDIYLYKFLFQRNNFFKIIRPEIVEISDFDQSLIHPNVLKGYGEEGVKRNLLRLKKLARQHSFKILVFGPLKEKILNICREVGVDFYDTFKEILPDKYPREYGVHFMHPSSKGHRVLAEHLESYLSQKGWL